MKQITFLGDALTILSNFPSDIKNSLGFELYAVQNGKMPKDFKTMPSVGKGVIEIREKNETGIFRVMYVAKFENFVYVLHAFQKKTQKTSKMDIEIAKSRYQQLLKDIQK